MPGLWVFKVENNPSATCAMLKLRYLLSHSEHCAVSLNAWAEDATTALGGENSSYRTTGGKPPGGHVRVQAQPDSVMGTDAGNLHPSLVKMTAYFWTSRIFEPSCLEDVKFLEVLREVLVIILGRLGDFFGLSTLKCWISEKKKAAVLHS